MIADVPTYRSPDEPRSDDVDVHGPARALAYLTIAVLFLVVCAIAAPAEPLRLLAILGAVFALTFALGRWIGLWGLLLPLPFLVWWIAAAVSAEEGDYLEGLALFVFGLPLATAIAGVLAGAFMRSLARLETD